MNWTARRVRAADLFPELAVVRMTTDSHGAQPPKDATLTAKLGQSHVAALAARAEGQVIGAGGGGRCAIYG